MSASTRIAKWGNSLAIRVPADILAKMDLGVGDPVVLSLKDDGLLMVPDRGGVDLQELLTRFDPKRHDYKALLTVAKVSS